MKKNTKITVDHQQKSLRLDKCIALLAPELTRSQLKTLNCLVKLNGKEEKLSKTVKNGDIIEIEYDTLTNISGRPEPENIEIDILYEDNNVAVINKKQGMVVHPAAGNFSGTLANALMHHLEENNEESDFDDSNARPGIVHRIDKETSGVIITAKNNASHEFLSQQFRDRTTVKKYLTIVKGKLPGKSGTIETYIARDPANRKKFAVANGKGKHAITHYKVLKEFTGASYLLITLETGRTHQIRVHMSSIGSPVIGDSLYSRKILKYDSYTMLLHAYVLQIEIPEKGSMKFFAPLPERFKRFIKENSTTC